jgi:uncharacterized protein
MGTSMSFRSFDFQHLPRVTAFVRTVVAGFALAVGAASASAAPSFDCAKASEEAEKAICKDAKLADLDAAIARAYAAATARLKGAAAKALQEDQRSFVAIRDQSFGLPDYSLAERLQGRLTFLESVAKALPASGGDFAGVWENSFGTVTIKPAAGGKLSIEAQSADPISARWVCDITDEVAPDKGVLSFTDGDTPADMTATISLRRDGPLLAVSEAVKPDTVRGYCGHRGALEGAYFRTGN